MAAVIGLVQPVRPGQPFLEISIHRRRDATALLGGATALGRRQIPLFIPVLIFGWTPWTGWTASAKSGTSRVQPKISTLDTLDRPSNPASVQMAAARN
jgi:hypothetical protein